VGFGNPQTNICANLAPVFDCQSIGFVLCFSKDIYQDHTSMRIEERGLEER
jgi:hypothetical protein